MNSKPMITVIVPVYNSEKYLRQCVDSILNQTYTHLEVILVDDGSPDRCGELCDQYAAKESRVKVVHKQNGGVSSARNAGLDIATGEYIAFVDSDDYLDSSLYEKAISVIHTYHPDIIDFGINFVDQEGNLLRKWHHTQTKETLFDRSHISENIIPELVHVKSQANSNIAVWVWNKLFRTNIINQFDIRFDSNLKLWEDGIFTIEVLKYANSLISLCGEYYNYRGTQDSLSQHHDEKIFSYAEIIYERYRSWFKNEYDFDNLPSRKYRFELVHGIIMRELKCLYTKKADVKSVRNAIFNGLKSKTIQDYYCGYHHTNPFFLITQFTIQANLLNLAFAEYYIYFRLKSGKQKDNA